MNANKEFSEKLAIEIVARFTGTSRGTPIAKKAFTDGALWTANELAQRERQAASEAWEAAEKLMMAKIDSLERGKKIDVPNKETYLKEKFGE